MLILIENTFFHPCMSIWQSISQKLWSKVSLLEFCWELDIRMDIQRFDATMLVAGGLMQSYN